MNQKSKIRLKWKQLLTGFFLEAATGALTPFLGA
jgi:hypothetical protein